MSEFERMRKAINREQSSLRKALAAGAEAHGWLARFLRHHAVLHSAVVSDAAAWSYEDALLDDVPEAHYRVIPLGEDHSIAWVLWHIARIEDAAMNLLVAGTSQQLLDGQWAANLNVPDVHSGNAQSAESISQFSRDVDLRALRAYRAAVGRRTQEIIKGLDPEDLEKRPAPDRLQRVRDENVFVEAAEGIVDYWGRRTISGLLLMPASRHLLTHLNEIYTLKRKAG